MAPRWGGLRIEPYKSEPIDADMDKIVQEGTAWERPGGTRMLDEFGKEILEGLEATTRPRDVRVVDKKGNAVAYTPTYGDQGYEAPSVATDVGGEQPSGLRTIQTTTVSQQEERRKAREAREAQRAASLPPIPKPPASSGPARWGSQEALREEFRRTSRGDRSPLRGRGDPDEDVQPDEPITSEEALESIAAIAETLLDPVDEAGDYTTVSLLEPEEGESGLVKKAREIIASPQVAALKKSLQRLRKFQEPLGRYENSKRTGYKADFRRAVDEAAVFFKDAHAVLQNMGITSMDDAMEMIRDGFEIGERRVVFVGKPLPVPPADFQNESGLELALGPSPQDRLRDGFYVMDANGNALVPVEVDEIPDEMMQALLDDPNADIPLELLIHAVREAVEDEDTTIGTTADELLTSILRVGALIGEAVRTVRAKEIRESARPEDFLSEILGRTDGELVRNAANDAAHYLAHEQSVGLDADDMADSHLTRPAEAARLNQIGASIAERILGYTPEWARADRPDKPHDPGRGYEDEAEGGAWNAEGGEGGWPVHQAMWNGDPLVLFEGLIDSLTEDFEQGRITEQQLLDTLDDLPTLVAEALHDEIDGIPGLADEHPDWAEDDPRHPQFFQYVGTEKLASAYDKVRAKLKDATGDLSVVEEMFLDLGMSDQRAKELVSTLSPGELEGVLTRFAAESQVRRYYGIWPADRKWSRNRSAVDGTTINVGDLVPARVSTPYLKSARGETLLESAWQVSIKDARRHRKLGDLIRAGKLTSVGVQRDDGLIAFDFLKKIREFATGSESIRELLRGEGVRVRTSAVHLDDSQVTEGELGGEFDHHMIGMVVDWEGSKILYGTDGSHYPIEALHRLLQRPNLSMEKRKEIKEAIEDYISYAEEAEDAVVRVLENYPIEWVRRLGLAGRLGLQTHKKDDSAQDGSEVIPQYKFITRGGYVTYQQGRRVWQPWADGRVDVSPEDGDSTVFHEVTHRLDAIHPMLYPVIQAFVMRRYGMDPDTPSGSLGTKLVQINDMPVSKREGHSYPKDEVAVDTFPSGYMGKAYPDDGDHRYVDDPGYDPFDGTHEPESGPELFFSEVLTVAMEALALPAEQRPFHLFEQGADAETTNFILGLLATI
jgi:hypothetical protein